MTSLDNRISSCQPLFSTCQLYSHYLFSICNRSWKMFIGLSQYFPFKKITKQTPKHMCFSLHIHIRRTSQNFIRFVQRKENYFKAANFPGQKHPQKSPHQHCWFKTFQFLCFYRKKNSFLWKMERNKKIGYLLLEKHSGLITFQKKLLHMVIQKSKDCLKS